MSIKTMHFLDSDSQELKWQTHAFLGVLGCSQWALFILFLLFQSLLSSFWIVIILLEFNLVLFGFGYRFFIKTKETWSGIMALIIIGFIVYVLIQIL